ncbi:hypothetical protein [Comamonas thiooxydans]|uniref:Uncharacterized protein n=1 Tax=Comamonas thiooxydans TaxID=363952 RepID=A0A0E3BTD3_9BURK|nr:hypothetical protein [Comamonas thiooxydans]KGH10440.1 hypothetical protein P608_15150 [Comamonas thiooxydans]KGH18194.1 hypothetical protein P607_15085 [Comamonas thiooxydans]KGH22399.1 hypothetical protein P606_16135 [Comamonas thiooxydans]
MKTLRAVRSIFRLLKKLSIAELSQTSPARLTARIRASYEYMNYLSVVQDFIRIPCGAGLRGNQHHEQTLSDQSYALLQEVMVSDS